MTATIKPLPRLTKDVELGEEKTRERMSHYIQHPPENSRIFTITPTIAEELLRDNINNRPKKPRDIMRYAEAMQAGFWVLTGDTIKFSNANRLRDGQNRLMACVRAGVSFRTHVVFGIEDSAFDRLDQGRNRNGADTLTIAGYSNASILTAAVRWANLVETGRAKQRDSYDPPKTLRLMRERYPTMDRFVSPARAVYGNTGQPAGLVCGLLYLFNASDHLKASEFADAWQAGSWAGKFKPIGLMQAKISQISSSAAGRVHDVLRAALIIIAWNLYVAGRKGRASEMIWTLGDNFPQIAEPMTEPAREVREITSLGDWLRWREHDITASRIAALFDVHPYLTRDDLASIMRGTAGGGAGPIPADSPAMRRGRILEPAVAAAITEEKPEWTLTKATTYHRLPEHRLGCTPDYWANEDGLIQVKTCSPQQWEKWRGRAPLAYVLQTLTEIIVTGRAWGVLAVMVCNPSYPVHYFDIPRHEAAERRILDAVATWWKAWDEGSIAPAWPSAGIAAELDDGSYRDLSSNNELPPLLAERAELTAQRRLAEKRLDAIDYVIKNTLGPASTGWLPGWQLTFKAYTRREMVIPEKVIRTLRVKAVTEEDGTEESAA